MVLLWNKDERAKWMEQAGLRIKSSKLCSIENENTEIGLRVLQNFALISPGLHLRYDIPLYRSRSIILVSKVYVTS